MKNLFEIIDSTSYRMGIFEDYERYLTQYQQLYGERTIVLYRNGSFFEVYGIDNEKEKVGAVREISNLLNIQMTRRNKAILTNDRSNFLLAGFPLNQLDRYIALLTEDNGYVVVIVDQITSPPNPKRGVTNVISPGTNLKHLSHPQGNYLISVYVESEGQKTNQIKPINLVTIGLSAIDVSTGHNVVYEVSNSVDDERRAFDETYRMIQTLQPKEILISSRHCTIKPEELFDPGQSLVHDQKETVPLDYYKLTYQNEFLSKIFPHTGMLKPIEYLNLEHQPTGLLSYLLLLNYCYHQKETMIQKIERPTIWNHHSSLILENNCISQLNLVSSGPGGPGGPGGISGHKYSSVFNLMDQTSTPMGKRLLKERLLLPLVDPTKIRERYDHVDFFRQKLDEPVANCLKLKHLPGHTQLYRCQQYEVHLKNIVDIERLHRKMCLGLLQPSELAQLYTSYQAIRIVLGLLTGPLVEIDLIDLLDVMMKDYQTIIQMDEASKQNLSNLTSSFFCQGYNSTIDQLQAQIDEDHAYLQSIATSLSQLISSSDKLVVNVEHTEDSGYYLEMTQTRYKTCQSRMPPSVSIQTPHHHYEIDPTTFEVLSNRTGKSCRLTSNAIKQVSLRLSESHEILLEHVGRVYKEFLIQMTCKHEGLMKRLVNVIALIDVYKSSAKTSLMYHYCRPEVNDTSEASLRAVQLRHPLIERLQETCQYVPQDVHFDLSCTGILLFGVNAVGKSSLMKAIGIATILAQAGLYVPATQFIYTPYHHLMTRIVGTDNLFKGLSSFAVEMGELRGILRRADAHSMILGDEICHGTETVSAVSLVSSAIITLSRTGSHFLFATHLHSLSQMERVTTLPNVRMYHLKVQFDQGTGHLVYDRRLEEGSGNPVYGLEVAKAMDLDRSFIDLANEIRQELMEIGSLVPTKKSRYNPQVYLTTCAIPGCHNPVEATHHIQFQSMADPTGFIDNHLQKNHKSNLLPLCQSCHDKLHDRQPGHETYIIKGYVMTSSGPQLDFERKINPVKSPPNISMIETKTVTKPVLKLRL